MIASPCESSVPQDEECDWVKHLRYRTSEGFEKSAPDVAVGVINMGYLSKAEFQGSQASIHKLGDYAVKVLRRTGGEKVIESFRQEAHILSRLKHAGACRLLAVGTALDNPCVVLEWVETDLARALDLHGKGPPHPSVEKRWPNAERLRFAVEIASALEHLHSGEAIDGGLVVIHRDIKPDNIGITVSGQVKLLDFGLAAVVEREVRGSEADETWNLTGFTGSVRYMAPEVARQSQYGTAVDIYSFAVSAWEFLSLRGVPFKNFTMLDHHNYVVKNGHRPKIPQCWDPRLAALVEATWAPWPAARPTASALGNVLRDLIENAADPLTATPTTFCGASDCLLCVPRRHQIFRWPKRHPLIHAAP